MTQLLKHGMKDLEEIIALLKQLGIKLQVCKNALLINLLFCRLLGHVICHETN